MTYPIQDKHNAIPENDPTTVEWNSDYDPELGEEFGLTSEDSYIDDSEQVGNAAPLTAQDLRHQVGSLLTELQGNRDLSSEEKSKLKKDIASLKEQINGAQALGHQKRQAKLGEISEALVGLSDQVHGIAQGLGDIGEGTSTNTEDLEKKLGELKNTIQSMPNLSEDEVVQYTSDIEKWQNEIQLAKGDPSKINVDEIESGMEDMKSEAEEKNQFSPGVKGIAEASGKEPEEIKTLAESKGVDLDNPVMGKQLIDFLVELNPELKDKMDAVKKAVNERQKFIDDNLNIANADNANNTGCTSDVDKFDISVWQNIYNAKYHQDDKSKAVVSAKEDFSNALLPLLTSLFPGKKIEKTTPTASSGDAGKAWESADNEYKVADQISIDGKPWDFFSNADGSFRVSDAPDADNSWTIPDIKYDAEGGAGSGGGEWYPDRQGMQTYGEGLHEANYDEDDG